MWKNIIDFFTTPKIGDVTPSYLKEKELRRGLLPPAMLPLSRTEETIYREKQESIALANLELQEKAHSHTIKIMHRNMIITLIAVVVAIFSAVAAIVIARNQPPPIVELNVGEQGVVQTID